MFVCYSPLLLESDMPSPIALFVYRRKDMTRQTVDALSKNAYAAQSDLLVFSDGPKSEADAEPVSRVREYVRSITGFRSVTVVESPGNKGLARSIIDGVTTVLKDHDAVIVLEDDMITSPHFLKYMNEGLDMYRKDDRVISIHGYVYPLKHSLPQSFFLRGADCWGWGTWKRGWDLFEPDGTRLLDELERRQLTRDFDYNGSYPFTQMLRDQIRGVNDSWAIRWQAAAFLKDKLTLYPGKSFVRNIGFDSSGTHSGVTDVYEAGLQAEAITLQRISVEEHAEARKYFEAYFQSIRPSLFARIRQKIFSGRLLTPMKMLRD